MDPFSKPHGEQLTDNARPDEESQEEMIVRLIKQFSPNIDIYRTGQRYYDNDPDIKHDAKPTDHEGSIDLDKPDWRIGHSFHANLIDQKVGYMVGEQPTVIHEDDRINNILTRHFSHEFYDDINDILTAASNKGIEWLHVYVSEAGEFKFMQIPAEQVIPIYADRKERILQAVIRHYKVGDQTRVEYWTETDVTYYTYMDGELSKAWYHDVNESNPTTHLLGESWGKVPFIPFKNNSDSVGDIWRYKAFVDAVNRRTSDLQNMFDESTELIYILKGYEGQDLSEFMQNLKYYKAINTDGEGGVDTIQVDVPVQSSIEYLEQMKQYIYDYGRGVDFNKNELGNSPSGIALRFLYTNLDLKAKQLARKTIPAIQQMVWFALEFENMDGDLSREVEINFQYNRMVNELEQSQIASASQSILSEETILANHPWVDDPEAEMERLEERDRTYGDELPIGGSDDE